jgi:hypothetical protein
MKKGFTVFFSVSALLLILASATLTQNDKAIFNNKVYLNSPVFVKPLADDGYYLKCVDSSTGKAQWAKGYTAYSRSIPGAQSAIEGKSYGKFLTTANGSGTVIDTLTTDGTSTGTSLFPNAVTGVSITAVYNDTVATAIPFGYVKAFGASNKTVTVRIVKGTSMVPAAIGTTFYLRVEGY